MTEPKRDALGRRRTPDQTRGLKRQTQPLTSQQVTLATRARLEQPTASWWNALTPTERGRLIQTLYALQLLEPTISQVLEPTN